MTSSSAFQAHLDIIRSFWKALLRSTTSSSLKRSNQVGRESQEKHTDPCGLLGGKRGRQLKEEGLHTKTKPICKVPQPQPFPYPTTTPELSELKLITEELAGATVLHPSSTDDTNKMAPRHGDGEGTELLSKARAKWLSPLPFQSSSAPESPFAKQPVLIQQLCYIRERALFFPTN